MGALAWLATPTLGNGFCTDGRTRVRMPKKTRGVLAVVLRGGVMECLLESALVTLANLVKGTVFGHRRSADT